MKIVRHQRTTYFMIQRRVVFDVQNTCHRFSGVALVVMLALLVMELSLAVPLFCSADGTVCVFNMKKDG